MQTKNLEVPMQLEGLNGNAFVLLGTFNKEARHAGYSPEEIKVVIDEATRKDYDHLLQTIIFNTVTPDDNEDEY